MKFFVATAFAVMWLTAGAFAEDVSVSGGHVKLEIGNPASAALHASLVKWTDHAGRAVAAYYGAYPVHGATVRVTLGSGREAADGESFGWEGPVVTVTVGRAATDASLSDDWILTHEMLHLAFPSLPERHHWLEEGLATYVEPIARARAGFLPVERIWTDLVRDLPQGLPEKGDRGLDYTHTWARTYWGGALFCLRADVEIRRRTGNRRGLEHVLRAINAAGGTIEHEWTIDRVVETGDRATGVPVLRELYDEMKGRPASIDLEVLWKQLGVERHGKSVRFREDAPLSAVRKAITAP